MKKLTLSIAALLLLSLPACQQFSISDDIELEAEEKEPVIEDAEEVEDPPVTPLNLTLSDSDMSSGESITLSPSGGVEPYSYSIERNALFYEGSLGTFSGNTYIAGNSVGKVRVVLEDSQGSQARQDLSLLPPAPHTLSGDVRDSTKFELSWNFSGGEEKISGFLIVRIDSGNHMTTIPVSRTGRNYLDENISAVEHYQYYIRSAADNLYSEPSNTVYRRP